MDNTTALALAGNIAAAKKELDVRMMAANHLKGIPARQNQTEINKLYDRLNDLYIQQYELDGTR